ncbi:MAG TPA: DUF5694 domain-containing protein [Sphingomicrobium sp.]|nr:DUF5694 domain-containing protein [Sphingomicrobium sp.]
MFVLIALAAHALAPAAPAFDPRSHRNEIAGKPAEILVLGTPHLSQLPKPLDPKLLEPLLDRLASFKPEVITIEALSGEECDTLQRFKARHHGAWDDYCLPTDEIEQATGLSVAAAQDEIDRTLNSWRGEPSPAARRRLAMLFLAANDRSSAQVQWLRLPEAERRSGNGLTPAMVEILERKGKPQNENIAIGAALAARLGLERVYPADDHLADGPDLGESYGKAIQAAWSQKPVPEVRLEYERRSANIATSSDLLAFYRFLNDPETQRNSIAGDMGRNASYPTPELYGRQYLAWWENRNLRMAANIRAAFAAKPDARVLVIVGATHKGYLDAYLDMMQDVSIIDAMQFLK